MQSLRTFCRCGATTEPGRNKAQGGGNPHVQRFRHTSSNRRVISRRSARERRSPSNRAEPGGAGDGQGSRTRFDHNQQVTPAFDDGPVTPLFALVVRNVVKGQHPGEAACFGSWGCALGRGIAHRASMVIQPSVVWVSSWFPVGGSDQRPKSSDSWASGKADIAKAESIDDSAHRAPRSEQADATHRQGLRPGRGPRGPPLPTERVGQGEDRDLYELEWVMGASPAQPQGKGC